MYQYRQGWFTLSTLDLYFYVNIYNTSFDWLYRQLPKVNEQDFNLKLLYKNAEVNIIAE